MALLVLVKLVSITFLGVSRITACRDKNDVLCAVMTTIMQEIPYTDWAQNNGIHSQVYKVLNHDLH